MADVFEIENGEEELNQILESKKAQKLIALYFYTQWSKHYEEVNIKIDQFLKIPGWSWVRIDVEKEQNFPLMKKYLMQCLPYFCLLVNGAIELDDYIVYYDLSRVVEQIRSIVSPPINQKK